MYPEKSNAWLIASIITVIVLGVAGGVYLWQRTENNQPTSQTKNDSGGNTLIVSNPQPPNVTEPTTASPLPTTCTDQNEGTPVITSLSSYSGPIGTKIEIKGCNFSGFEGDKNALIVNSQGIKGILFGETGSTSNLVRVSLKSRLCQMNTSYSGLPCDASMVLTPGVYRIYVTPWGKKSNEVAFTIK